MEAHPDSMMQLNMPISKLSGVRVDVLRAFVICDPPSVFVLLRCVFRKASLGRNPGTPIVPKTPFILIAKYSFLFLCSTIALRGRRG
jgi:hypothetical protein